MKKTIPFYAALAVAGVSVIVRLLLTFFNNSSESYEYSGSTLVLSLFAALLVAVFGGLIWLSYKTAKDKVSDLPQSSGYCEMFICATSGFFFLFIAAFQLYALIKGVDFHTGASTASEIILLFASLGTAFLFFIQSGSLAESARRYTAYPLLYLFPIAWAADRLYMLFVKYTASVIGMTEKLQMLCLVVICVYFLYEARFVRSTAPVKALPYTIASIAAIIIIPLSALPTLLFSLIYNTGFKIGEPLLCLAELSVAAYVAIRYINVINDKTAVKPDENN